MTENNKWRKIPSPAAKDIASDFQGNLWIIGKNKGVPRIYNESKKKWQRLKGFNGATRFDALNSNTVATI